MHLHCIGQLLPHSYLALRPLLTCSCLALAQLEPCSCPTLAPHLARSCPVLLLLPCSCHILLPLILCFFPFFRFTLVHLWPCSCCSRANALDVLLPMLLRSVNALALLFFLLLPCTCPGLACFWPTQQCSFPALGLNFS